MVSSTGSGVAMSNVRVKHNVSNAVTTSMTLTPAHDTVQVDTSATNGKITLTLPSSDASMTGRKLSIMDTGGNCATNTIIIQPAGTDTISGYAMVVLNHDNGMVALSATGNGKWFVQVSV